MREDGHGEDDASESFLRLMVIRLMMMLYDDGQCCLPICNRPVIIAIAVSVVD
jgi:hypothetical protein